MRTLQIILIVLLATACRNKNPSGQEASDTPTAGAVTISVDESYTLMIENQVYTFEHLYERAKVKVQYRSEKEAVGDLLNDSSKVAILCRKLSGSEEQFFKSKNIYPKTTKIALDAVALIVHPESPDSQFTVSQIKNLLIGSASTWPSAPNEPVQIVFDHPQSGNARYMTELIGGAKLAAHCYAKQNNQEVINYVAQHKEAIGIIGLNWISDKDDTLSQNFLDRVVVAGITKEALINPMTKLYKPYQAYLVTGDYPFVREVYAINRQTRAGLGMGFVSFVAGEKGQRLIKLQGMVPANMPVRLIDIK